MYRLERFAYIYYGYYIEVIIKLQVTGQYGTGNYIVRIDKKVLSYSIAVKIAKYSVHRKAIILSKEEAN